MAGRLTDKQEKFAQLVVELGNQSAAYREAYDVVEATPKSVTELASQLANQVNVSSRIQEIRDEVAERLIWSKLDSLTVLSDIAHNGEAQHKDQIAAVKELNSMKGWQKKTVDNVSSDGSMTPQITPEYKIADE